MGEYDFLSQAPSKRAAGGRVSSKRAEGEGGGAKPPAGRREGNTQAGEGTPRKEKPPVTIVRSGGELSQEAIRRELERKVSTWHKQQGH